MPTKKLREHVLQDGATGTNTGTWKEVTAWGRISIEFEGISGDTCQIYGSCAPTQPADATDGVQIGSDVTEDSIHEISAKLKWIKVKVSVYSAGTINAYGIGDETYYGM